MSDANSPIGPKPNFSVGYHPGRSADDLSEGRRLSIDECRDILRTIAYALRSARAADWSDEAADLDLVRNSLPYLARDLTAIESEWAESLNRNAKVLVESLEGAWWLRAADAYGELRRLVR